MMSANTKAILVTFIFFFIVFVGVRYTMSLLFNIEDNGVLSAISAVLAVILTPRRSVVITQSGKEVYLKWLFSKKVYRIK